MALGHERLDFCCVVGKALEEDDYDSDPDGDSDLDEIKPQQRGGGDWMPRLRSIVRRKR